MIKPAGCRLSQCFQTEAQGTEKWKRTLKQKEWTGTEGKVEFKWKLWEEMERNGRD